MRVHPKLLLLSAINFLGAFALSWYIDSRGPENARMMNLFLGWIFWLGIFAVIFPVLIRDDVKKEWFSGKYVYASFIIFFVNVFIPMLANYISLKLTQ